MPKKRKADLYSIEKKPKKVSGGGKAKQSNPKSHVVDEVFIVEKIVGKGYLNGELHYKVKWKGYDNPADDTWETIDNCHSCQDEIDNFEKENAGKEPVELEWTKDYSIIISAKKTKGRKQSQQLELANKNKPVEADVDATETEDEDGEDLELDAIPLVEKEHYNLLKEGIKVDKMIGMTKLNGKKMALLSYTDDSMEYVPTEVIREHKEARSLVLKYYLEHIEFTY